MKAKLNGKSKPTVPSSSPAAVVAATLKANPNASAETVRAAIAASAAQAVPPVYGHTYFDSGARYPTVDPVTPPADDGSVVKLAIMKYPDMDFIRGVCAENDALVDNPNYTTPSPSLAEMTAACDEMRSQCIYVEQLKALLRDAVNTKNATRATLEGLYKLRASYVQLTSNGNTNLILNAGFAVRSSGTPVGILPPPYGLFLELNGTPGIMALSWVSVLNARGYNIQWSYADTMERNWLPYETTTAARYRCVDLELGKVYAFRIAAIGGSTGQSDWSAEVVRMAA